MNDFFYKTEQKNKNITAGLTVLQILNNIIEEEQKRQHFVGNPLLAVVLL